MPLLSSSPAPVHGWGIAMLCTARMGASPAGPWPHHLGASSATANSPSVLLATEFVIDDLSTVACGMSLGRLQNTRGGFKPDAISVYASLAGVLPSSTAGSPPCPHPRIQLHVRPLGDVHARHRGPISAQFKHRYGPHAMLCCFRGLLNHIDRSLVAGTMGGTVQAMAPSWG